MGHVDNYRWVYYYPNGIANILTLAKLSKKYWITFDRREGNQFKIHVKWGNLAFGQSNNCQYYFNTMNHHKLALTNGVFKIVTQSTIGFSKYQYEKAQYAIKVQKIVGDPSNRNFKTWCIAICLTTVLLPPLVLMQQLISLAWKSNPYRSKLNINY